jgi:hypothetical protein
MSEAKNQHDEAVVFEFADEPVVADSVFPKLAQSPDVQRLSYSSWIIQAGDSFVEKLQDALGLRRVELAQLGSASADSSTVQAMTLHHVFQRYGLLLATADALESTLGEIEIL